MEKPLIPGEVVRIWTGQKYRVGYYLRTIERGRHRNKKLISVGVWSQDKGHHRRHLRIPPDHVKRVPQAPGRTTS